MSEKENNAVVVSEQVFGGAAVMPFMTSLPNETIEDKAFIFNALNSPDEQLIDHLGREIAVVHIMAQKAMFANEETGEEREGTRVVIVDKEGTTYSCVSEGIAGAFTNLFNIGFQPPFEPALVIIPKQVKSRRDAMKKVLTFDLAAAKKKKAKK